MLLVKDGRCCDRANMSLSRSSILPGWLRSQLGCPVPLSSIKRSCIRRPVFYHQAQCLKCLHYLHDKQCTQQPHQVATASAAFAVIAMTRLCLHLLSVGSCDTYGYYHAHTLRQPVRRIVLNTSPTPVELFCVFLVHLPTIYIHTHCVAGLHSIPSLRCSRVHSPSYLLGALPGLPFVVLEQRLCAPSGANCPPNGRW